MGELRLVGSPSNLCLALPFERFCGLLLPLLFNFLAGISQLLMQSLESAVNCVQAQSILPSSVSAHTVDVTLQKNGDEPFVELLIFPALIFGEILRQLFG